jgi:hypothetical protein
MQVRLLVDRNLASTACAVYRNNRIGRTKEISTWLRGGVASGLVLAKVT